MKYIYSLLFAVLFLASCDTYGDYDQDFSPIYPLSGQYYVTVYDGDGVALSKTYLYLYNTASNATDALWVKLGSKAVNWGILGKVACDVKTLTFAGEAPNLAISTDGATSSKTFTVNSGQLFLDAATTPTNGKSDSISVAFNVEGVKYSASGFRHTGWGDDEK